MKRFLAIGI